MPLVAFPCGSRSTSSTRRSETASDAARLTAVVVFPTPPFWFAIARTSAISPSHHTASRWPKYHAIPAPRKDAFHVEHAAPEESPALRSPASGLPLEDGDAALGAREGEPVSELLLQHQVAVLVGHRVRRPEHAERDSSRQHVLLGQREPGTRLGDGAGHRRLYPRE